MIWSILNPWSFMLPINKMKREGKPQTQHHRHLVDPLDDERATRGNVPVREWRLWQVTIPSRRSDFLNNPRRPRRGRDLPIVSSPVPQHHPVLSKRYSFLINLPLPYYRPPANRC